MTKTDTYKIESIHIKRRLDLNLAHDLVVRRYHDRNTKGHFLIIYVGACRKQKEIIRLLIEKGLIMTK
jgi:hypothetical protein